nr:MAG TPA: hypothetical protein [Caudoviricetes sp.]
MPLCSLMGTKKKQVKGWSFACFILWSIYENYYT